MKRILALLLAAIVAVSVLSACSININLGGQSTEEPQSDDGTTIEIPTIEIPTEEIPIGTVDDYVRVYKEKNATYGDGNKNVLRIPEILLDSEDAKAANDEIVEKYGKVFTSEQTGGIVNLDYEAYLNDSVLSVIVTVKVDGGNTDGLGYNFDVLTGKKLSNKELCEVIGEDYEEKLTQLGEAMEISYDERFGKLPSNDTERAKTFEKSNLEASTLYLNDSGNWMAIALFYAAVGGGHFMTQVEL